MVVHYLESGKERSALLAQALPPRQRGLSNDLMSRISNPYRFLMAS